MARPVEGDPQDAAATGRRMAGFPQGEFEKFVAILAVDLQAETFSKQHRFEDGVLRIVEEQGADPATWASPSVP